MENENQYIHHCTRCEYEVTLTENEQECSVCPVCAEQGIDASFEVEEV